MLFRLDKRIKNQRTGNCILVVPHNLACNFIDAFDLRVKRHSQVLQISSIFINMMKVISEADKGSDYEKMCLSLAIFDFQEWKSKFSNF